MDDPTASKVCSKCGATKPLAEYYARSSGRVQSDCKDCARARQRDYGAANREANAARNAEWRARNGEQHRSKSREWYYANKERHRASALKWSRENADYYREYNKRWYEDNREARLAQMREYDLAHPEQVRERNRRQSSAWRARKLGSSVVPFTRDQLQARIDYYGGMCWICKVAPFEQLDHVKPLSKGGPHILANLRPACRSCNTSKSAKWPFVA